MEPNLTPAAARRGRLVHTHRTTLYRLDGVPPDADGLRSGLNHRYVTDEGFTTAQTTVAHATALLVHGSVAREKAVWCDWLTRLTGDDVAVGHSSSGGALLIAADEVVYALTYGTIGRHLINRAAVDPGFGVEFAIRALGPERINQITRSVLASSGRVDQNLVPGGQHIRQFTVEQWGEIVGKISGPLRNGHQLTATRLGRRPVTIAGAESLQIPLGADPSSLLADLHEISAICASATPVPALEFIAQMRPLPAGPRTDELNRRLDDLLAGHDPNELGLAVPVSQIEHEPFATAYEIRIPGFGRSHEPQIAVEDLLDRVKNRPTGKRLSTLKHGTIGLCGDDHRDVLAPPTPAHRWITTEIADGAARILYHDGRWYEMGTGHLDALRAEIAEILGHPATVALPAWTNAEPDEDAYNRKAAGDGYVLLDKKLLKTRQHARGIEACDLLGPNGELICVKRADRSSPLSHLFFQGEVAVDALLHEQDARERLVEMVQAAAPGHPITANYKPTKIVFAIALKSSKPLTVDTLFTFSQVALYRTVRHLRSDGIDVEVVGIPAA